MSAVRKEGRQWTYAGEGMAHFVHSDRLRLVGGFIW
jgi:hypothetical protein